MYNSDLLTYSRFTHMSSVDEGYNNLRVPPGVWAMKVPSTIDQPPSFPAAGSFPEGLDLRVYASGWPFVTFGAMEAVPFGPKAYLRPSEGDILRPEGHDLRACAS